MRFQSRRYRGVALIFSAGALVILAALGTAFYVISQASVMSAARYQDMVRADMLARAGIHEAVARLRVQAFSKPEDPGDPWSTVNYLDGLSSRISFAEKNASGNPLPYSRALGSTFSENGDRYLLQIEDTSGKININTGDNLAVILDNLCRAVGVPLVAADEDALQPRVWATHGAPAALYATALNADDSADTRDLLFRLGTDGRPLVDENGHAICGDGYAIAGYRARNGRFHSIGEVRHALTYVERNGNGLQDDPLELLEVEGKYAVLKDHITIDSWVDTTTLGVGKFEWAAAATVSVNVRSIVTGAMETGVTCQVLIDRDKSWIADDPVNDPRNEKGSLRGSYVSIINGHGTGQLRRIATNGADWIAIRNDTRMTVPPGPISSYLILAREDALLEQVPNTNPPTHLPKVNADGSMVDDPAIDYADVPLCIHRAPVNINTASDKVLTALIMGLNVQHGSPMAVGTDAQWPNIVPAALPAPPLDATSSIWKTQEYANRSLEPYLLTMKGLKRVPVDSGKLDFSVNRATDMPVAAGTPAFDYLDNYGGLAKLNVAHDLAFRVIYARQQANWAGNPLGNDPATGYPRGPFRTWDDLYFRVVKPWDDVRNTATKVSVARLIMANFNSNTDILKFNPNIEWIDRYGRNFTEMEPVMVHDADEYMPTWVTTGVWNATLVNGLGKEKGSYVTRSLRYKADEMIDKTDLNRSTTEFAFTSSGVYRITSTGQVFSPHNLLAERKFEMVVKVFEVWRESTQEQFVRGCISRAQDQDSLTVDVKNTGQAGNFDCKCNNLKNGNGSGGQPSCDVNCTCYCHRLNRTGRIARDARNTGPTVAEPTRPFYRLALDTWPEPLVPLGYTIAATDDDLVAIQHYDAFGNQKAQRGIPDILANRVLPSRYDGQITLATNTSECVQSKKTAQGGDAYTEFHGAFKNDTFLASFDGDLDTATALGSGREQAKTPGNYKVRVLDTIGLLGLLNDTQVDFDPTPKDTFASSGLTIAALDGAKFWQNVTCRVGDLRPEGVYLGSVGASGKDATLKYPLDNNWMFSYLPGNTGQENKDPSNGRRAIIRMWMKPNWHQSDGQEHEFFNGSNTGHGGNVTEARLVKFGKFSDANTLNGGMGGGNENDLYYGMEDMYDREMSGALHGGITHVPTNNPSGKVPYRESPAYRVQPFRWHYVGYHVDTHYSISADDPTDTNTDDAGGLDWRDSTTDARLEAGEGKGFIEEAYNVRGRWQRGGGSGAMAVECITNRGRPVIDTARDPEGVWNARYFHQGNEKASMNASNFGDANTKQKAAWDWASSAAGANAQNAIWGINNLNNTPNASICRTNPIDGTQAVIDELKISIMYHPGQGAAWAWGFWKDLLPEIRMAKEMTTSRYYLPNDPSSSALQPTFTSQTLLSSLRGSSSTAGEEVSVVRVSWNVFTPRFMHENKVQTARKRAEAIGDRDSAMAPVQQAFTSVSYRGPFDYLQYNHDILPGTNALDPRRSEPSFGANLNPLLKVDGVNALHGDRPTAKDYPEVAGVRQSHASKGVEVELIQDPDGTPDSGDETILGGTTFTNPDAMNVVGATGGQIRVKSGQLHYRVRFKYPIDYFVQTAYGSDTTTINQKDHYIIDTPVFEDISIVYFREMRILDFCEVFE